MSRFNVRQESCISKILVPSQNDGHRLQAMAIPGPKTACTHSIRIPIYLITLVIMPEAKGNMIIYMYMYKSFMYHIYIIKTIQATQFESNVHVSVSCKLMMFICIRNEDNHISW